MINKKIQKYVKKTILICMFIILLPFILLLGITYWITNDRSFLDSYLITLSEVWSLISPK